MPEQTELTEQAEQTEQAANDGLVAARESLSTAESVSGDIDEIAIVRPRRLGFPALVLRGWRQLTTMRTALLLLFALAIAAIPGSLFPQRGVNTPRVEIYYLDHPRLAPILERVGFFNVFGSTWFYTLYALLAVSLVGCLLPRLRLHAKAIGARPPAAPRHFDRLPLSTSFVTASLPDDAIAAAQQLLRRARWRADRRTDAAGVPSVAAEKGYLRETGNLVFHVALLVLLGSVAIGALLGYSGIFSVIEGGTPFTNAVLAYDGEPRLGQWVKGSSLHPFTLRLDDFRATYLPNNQPSSFHADVTWSPGPGKAERRRDIQVNHPLAVGGGKVYLLGSGFAPRFVVRDKAGNVVSDEYVRLLPAKNANQYSTGVLKVPNGLPYDVGLRAVYIPTFAMGADGSPYSSSPEAKAPVVLYRVFTGDLRLTTAQSVYDFDERGMSVAGEGVLLPGRRITLADGASIAWEDTHEYAVFQTTRNPGTRTAFFACLFGLLGLIASLFVRRRRMWVRATSSPGGTVISVGGLARHDAERFRTEFDELAEQLRGRLEPAPADVPPPVAPAEES